MQRVNPFRLILKAILIFSLINLAYAAFNPQIGDWSIYNWLVPGRPRLPIEGTWNDRGFGVAANQQIGALFSAHQINARALPTPGVHVILLGDSQTYGAWVPLEETLGARLDAENLVACSRPVTIENLSHPGPSVLRDFLILDRALQRAPNSVIVWMLEPNAFLPSSESLLFEDSSGASKAALEAYGLSRYADLPKVNASFFDRTLWSQRGEIHAWLDLQMFGLYWAASGDDEWVRYNQVADLRSFEIPLSNEPTPSVTWHGYLPADAPNLHGLYSVLDAARLMAGTRPAMLVAQPIFVASGPGSDIRYNSLYPRWAYDDFRATLAADAARNSWGFLDLHGALPSSDYVDEDHLNGDGEAGLAQILAPDVVQLACSFKQTG